MDTCNTVGADGTLAFNTLDDVPADVARPSYSREALSAGILHFGVVTAKVLTKRVM